MAFVGNKARFSWPYSGHQCAMSVIGPGKTGLIPCINVQCPEHGQSFMALFRTSLSFPGHVPDITGHIPDTIGHIPDTTGLIPDITGHVMDISDPISDITGHIPDISFFSSGHVPDIIVRCQEYGQCFLAMFRTSKCVVWNMASISWPCSRHRSAMSGIRPGSKILSKMMFGTSSGHPEYGQWCPEQGQWCPE